ncbi:MAG: methyltransferase domain-containing protein [Methanotrichaceae archaeon]|nr:methyltransferase domain-containing protein [Methanotrichaceae archaeon]
MRDIVIITDSNSGLRGELGENWHGIENWDSNIIARWMINDAAICIISDIDQSVDLSLRAASFYKDRILKIYLNEVPVHKEVVSPHDGQIFQRIRLPLSLKKGENVLIFHSLEEPQRPLDIVDLKSTDNRWLSLASHNIRLISKKKFNPEDFPSRINLGCGFDILPGYLNVDIQESFDPDLVSDMTKLEQLPSEYYEEILAKDCLEHLPRSKVKPALEEWYRLLKKGGLLKIRVPSLINLLRNLENASSIDKKEFWIKCLYGTQAFEGDYHLSGFTKDLLRNYLSEAGFINIKLKLENGWLLEGSSEKNNALSTSKRSLFPFDLFNRYR